VATSLQAKADCQHSSTIIAAFQIDNHAQVNKLNILTSFLLLKNKIDTEINSRFGVN